MLNLWEKFLEILSELFIKMKKYKMVQLDPNSTILCQISFKNIQILMKNSKRFDIDEWFF